MWRTIGQHKALALLKHSLKTSSLAHAYLFVGPPHVGKNTLALDLAQAVNCQKDEPPCGKCLSCCRINDGKHSDITIIGLNSTKGSRKTKPHIEISIEDIRELQRNAILPPYEGKYKVFIIDGAENLSDEAANCLLKTLEEPPPRVLILLLTTEESRLLPTVISRCQRVELKVISIDEIEKVIIESRVVDSDKAKLLARLSHGCLGWALAASMDDNYLMWRTQELTKMFSLLSDSWGERFIYAMQLGSDRKSTEELINLWLIWWRDVMLTKCGYRQAITNIDHATTLEEWAQILSLLEIKEFLINLQKSLTQISRNANLRLAFETLLLDMPRKETRHGQIISSSPSI